MPENTPNDIKVTEENIKKITSADEIANFFTRLGYDDQHRLPVKAEQLGFPQSLQNSVQELELITRIGLGTNQLQIYFIRLLSVTVTRIRELVQQFKDRGGMFLLVLTDDFTKLDFVLLERDQPSLPGFNLTAKSVAVTIRHFTVDRNQPDRVAKRVLSRITLTEYNHDDKTPNVLFQYRKLKSAFTIAAWSHPEFNNRALFSDYYLITRLPEQEEWHAENRNTTFRKIREVFANARQAILADGSEAPERLVKPVLEAMGGRLEEKEETYSLLFAEGTEKPGAFVLAYPWNRYLDGKDPERDKKHGETNPGALVVKLLEDEVAPWGIVTNGKVWRLYSAKAHSRATNYYEIDLEETLGLPEPGLSFRFFYLFFRAAAFKIQDYLISGKTKAMSFLDFILEQSGSYARELGDRLKGRVFEDIFPHFAEGFIESMGGADNLLALPEEAREAKLKIVFDGTLTFLYRLLFILYAESRDLLPDREVRGYYDISLQKMKEEIAEKAESDFSAAPHHIEAHFKKDQTNLYDRLMTLFHIIDKGDPSKNVPIYNGGLFDTAPDNDDDSHDANLARFLVKHKLSDQHLALGLDLLTREVDPQVGRLGFVDYKSLGVRQLGSIYEGLLEFKVRIATEKMAVVKGSRVDEVVPYAQAKKEKRQILRAGHGQNAKQRILRKGTIYIENNRGERRSTGSYYTPDYIVKYMVKNTVGPVLDEKLEALRPMMQKISREFHAILQHKIEVENVVNPNRFAILQYSFGEDLQKLFDIKILDPAMGSGHFLVEAVDYVTDRLVQFLDGYPFISDFFDGIKATILEEMRDQKVSINPDRLTDVTLLKRHVLKRCVYGVDINPMAVELAKLSLWLDCFTLGAPLSFLDHHLRCGNSLIGVMAQDLEENKGENGQMSLLTGPFTGLLQAAEIMRGVSKITDVTVLEVEKSRQMLKAFDKAAKPFKQLLDIYVSQYFGVERSREFLDLHSQQKALNILKDQKNAPSIYTRMIERVNNLFKKERFFHWDLEFPEVFIDLEYTKWKNDAGFDVVIGNPPYVRSHTMVKSHAVERDYISNSYFTAKGNWDLYIPFWELSINLLCKKGIASLITPNKWIVIDYGQHLRQYCENLIYKIGDFSNGRAFSDAGVFPIVSFMSKERKARITYEKFNEEFEKIDKVVFSNEILQRENGWRIFVSDVPKLLIKVFSITEHLSKRFQVEEAMAVNDAYLISNYVKDNQSLKDAFKLIITGTIDRYINLWGTKSTRFLGNTYSYPVVENSFLLNQFQRRYDQSKDRKIIISGIRYFEAYYDHYGDFIAGISTIIVRDLRSDSEARILLSILNSHLISYLINQVYGALAMDGGITFSAPLVSELPIPLPKKYTSKPNSLDSFIKQTFLNLSNESINNKSFGEILSKLSNIMIKSQAERKKLSNNFWEEIKKNSISEIYLILHDKGKQERTLARNDKIKSYADPTSRSIKNLQESLSWTEEAFIAFAGMLIGKSNVTPAMVEVYRKYHPKYLSLTEKIKATDNLIDQIVYRLYGLTEEEIAIIEEKN